ncbi:MAG TPA: hypothetical protein VFL54_08475 [Gammaproteobacteria bacterium]|nr:hypothetical protein [Gammaproteobacteria bacterium]
MDERVEALEHEQIQLALSVIERLRHDDPELADALIETFVEVEAAADWLIFKVPSQGYQRPVTLLRDGERDQVIYTLGCIRYGLPA